MSGTASYDVGMLTAVMRHLKAWVVRKEQLLPAGFSWVFVATVDVTMVVIGGIAALQRPVSDWPVAAAAMMIAFSPWLVFFICNVVKHEGPALSAAWLVGTAILLFATSTPITGDVAPLLLSLEVGVVSAVTSVFGGFMAAVSAMALLGGAAALHRLETPLLYLAFIGIGWLVGYLMRIQQDLILEQRAMQNRLATLAAADERRRIAHEVHDVIAHSLSITLLHLTGARHTLEHDGDALAVIGALQQAERQGRHAMADIRRTVGLLDSDPTTRSPEPGIGDITTLTEDFSAAGLEVVVDVDGSFEHVSAAVGSALYRVAQESLSNVAKHAPHSAVALTLAISAAAVDLSVINQLPATGKNEIGVAGRGVRGMRQRIELLGGVIEVGPASDQWVVHVSVPAGAVDAALAHRIAVP